MITIIIILLVAVLLLAFFQLIISDNSKQEAVSYVIIWLCSLSILFLGVIKKEIPKQYLNGNPPYEKQYIINSKGEKVDSIYVKIKTDKP
jgi:hypothetical protein